MKVSEEVLKVLLNTIKHRAQHFPRSEHLRKLINGDKAYYMSDRQRKNSTNSDKEEVKSRYEEVGIGVVNSAVEAEVTFMDKVFLSDPKIFPFVSSTEFKELATAVQTLSQQHAMRTRWKSNFISFFRDCAKYNLGILKADWIVKQTYTKQVGLDISEKNKLTNVVWQGNEVKWVDLYNCLWDTSVSPVDIPEEGEFFAHIELMTQVRLYKLIESFKLDPEDNEMVDFDEANLYTSSAQGLTNNLQYEEPPLDEIIPDYLNNATIENKHDWLSFAGEQSIPDRRKIPKSDSLYNVCTFYLRLIPNLYGHTDGDSNQIQIWRIVLVNGQYIVRVKRETNLHNLIPIGVAEPTEDSLKYNTPGNIRLITPIQKLMKQLLDRRLASLDRNIRGKTLLNGKYIKKEEYDNRAADGTIMLNALAADIPMGQIIQELPFNDSSSNLISQELPYLGRLAEEILGINAASKGQFVKGNRTLQEYQDIMGNADSKQFTRAGIVEAQCFSIIKMIIKSNILQYATETELLDTSSGTVKHFNPADFQRALLDFKLADGLNPASQFINAQETIALFQILSVLAADNNSNYQIDIMDMLIHVLKQGKNIDLSQYIQQKTATPNS